MMSPAALYRIFQRGDGAAPSVRAVVIALVVAAALLTCAGVIRVARQHEVLRLGFELSRRTEQLGRLQEARRQLELELATLAAPDRIRRLATQLGMAPVSPDRIRIVGPAPAEAMPSAVHAAPAAPAAAMGAANAAHATPEAVRAAQGAARATPEAAPEAVHPAQGAARAPETP